MSDSISDNSQQADASIVDRPSFLRARDPSIDRRFRPRPERQVRLFDEIREERNVDAYDEADISSSYDDGTIPTSDYKESGNESNSTAMVFLRLRPVQLSSISYTIADTGNVLIAGPSIEMNSTSNNKNKMEQHYSFSAIFDGKVKQDEVYRTCIGQKIESEESFTVLTYGTSGSGKTFTLLGQCDFPGIVPRAIENLFSLNSSNIYPQPAIKLDKANVKILDDEALIREENLRRTLFEYSADLNSEYERMHQKVLAEHNFQSCDQNDVSVFIWISFVEIYNESVYDLLAPPQAPPKPGQAMAATQPRNNLKVIGNDGKVFIKGLTSVYIKSSAEALRLLYWGLQHVSYASTSINANSSRSHCIFTVDVLKYNSLGTVTETSYKFCDLAGSERLDKTRNVGNRLTEAKGINTSLMTLGRCLDAANNSRKNKSKGPVIPFRESKLTMLLQAALLGKEKLTMIVNVMPTDAYYEENMNVLRFAAIAKNIIFKEPVRKHNRSRYSFLVDRSNIMVNAKSEFNERIQQLLEENIFLRSEIERINREAQFQLLEQERILRKELVDSFEQTFTELKKDHENELAQQQRMFELKFASQKRQYEEQLEDLHEQLEDSPKKRRTLD